MSKKRITAKLYTIDGYVYVRDPGHEHHYELKSLPDNRLYSGWGTRYPTKITVDDLPEWYVYLTDYRKHGYLSCKDVTAVAYLNSPFDNHWLKDADLLISYTLDKFELAEPTFGRRPCGALEKYRDDDGKSVIHIWGSDILTALKGIMKYSPDVDVGNVIDGIIADYNAYADDRNKWGWEPHVDHIDNLDKFLVEERLRADLNPYWALDEETVKKIKAEQNEKN